MIMKWTQTKCMCARGYAKLLYVCMDETKMAGYRQINRRKKKLLEIRMARVCVCVSVQRVISSVLEMHNTNAPHYFCANYI